MNSTTIILVSVILFIALILCISLIMYSKYYILTKLYIYNAETIEVVENMTFTIKLKRVKALSTERNTENKKQYTFLSINYDELLNKAEKISKLNEKYYSEIKSLRLKSANKIQKEILQGEIRDLTLEALDLTKKLDELTYTSTVSTLVQQKIIEAFNNFKNVYDENNYKSSAGVQKKINRLVQTIEQYFKDYTLNNYESKEDKNLITLKNLILKVEEFGLIANKYPIMEGILQEFIIPKHKSINKKIKAYEYNFDSKIEEVINYNESINRKMILTKNLLHKDNYDEVFKVMSDLIGNLFEFNFWVKLQIDSANIIDENTKNVSIDMNNVKLFHENTLKKLSDTNYINQDQKDELSHQLNVYFNDLSKLYKMYEKDINISSARINIDNIFKLIKKYFDSRDKYYNFIDSIMEIANSKVKPIIDFNNKVSKLNKYLIEINRIIKLTDVTINGDTMDRIHEFSDRVKYYLNVNNIGVNRQNDLEIEGELEVLDEKGKLIKEYLYANYLVNDLGNKIVVKEKFEEKQPKVFKNFKNHQLIGNNLEALDELFDRTGSIE